MPIVILSSAWAPATLATAAPAVISAAMKFLFIPVSSFVVTENPPSLPSFPRAPSAPRQLARAAALAEHAVEPDRDYDDDADRHLLDRLRHVEHDKAVEQDAHDEGADDGVADLAAAAEQRGAADHRRGDRLELEALARDRLRCHQTRGEDEGGNADAEAADRIDREGDELDIDAGCPRRFAIAADRIDVASEARIGERDPRNDRDDCQDEHRYGNAE